MGIILLLVSGVAGGLVGGVLFLLVYFSSPKGNKNRSLNAVIAFSVGALVTSVPVFFTLFSMFTSHGP